jgi:hypothetical protein
LIQEENYSTAMSLSKSTKSASNEIKSENMDYN